MIKKVCLSFVCLAFAVAMSAQTAEEQVRPDVEETVEYEANPHRVITNTFWNNWYVGIGGGAQYYFGDNYKLAKFGQMVVPAMDIYVGKWFTPVVGARLTFSGFNSKGADANADVTSFPVYHLHGDFMLNMNTLIAGYKEDRIWSIIPYVGVGWAFHKGDNEPSITAGILNTFSVTKRLDINLDIHGAMFNDVYDSKIGGRNWEGLLTAAVGVSYKLGKPNWDRPKTVYRTDHSEANALLKKLNAANTENADLKKSLADAEARAKATPKEVVKTVAADDIVLFNIGESKLTKAAQVSLGSFAGMIKDLDPNTVYVITGYADAGTGSKKWNEKLSKARAEAAYDCLVNKYGVNPEQLKIDYKGGVENMFFDDPSLSRAVIITIE